MQTKLKEPKLCEDRGRFYIWLDRKRHYFAAKGRAEAEVNANSSLANLWLGNSVIPSRAARNNPPDGYSPPQELGTGGMLIAELASEFLKYHTPRLSKNEGLNFKYAIGYLVELHGDMSVNDITPKKLRNVRELMVWSGRLCRKTKIVPSQAARDKARAAKPSYYSEFYNMGSYRSALEYAINKGNKVLPEGEQIPHWFPYLLRNATATDIELKHGLDQTQTQLGHKSANMTRRYSKAQLRMREKLAREQENPFADEPNESAGLTKPKEDV